jgi:hypothetical protein
VCPKALPILAIKRRTFVEAVSGFVVELSGVKDCGDAEADGLGALALGLAV